MIIGRGSRRVLDRSAVTALSGSFGSFLFTASSAAAVPGRQLRLHVHYLLPGREQLLGQQVPKTAGALDAPGSLRHAAAIRPYWSRRARTRTAGRDAPRQAAAWPERTGRSRAPAVSGTCWPSSLSRAGSR